MIPVSQYLSRVVLKNSNWHLRIKLIAIVTFIFVMDTVTCHPKNVGRNGDSLVPMIHGGELNKLVKEYE